jgi:PhoPQ-activated pathogenicity-related protein
MWKATRRGFGVVLVVCVFAAVGGVAPAGLVEHVKKPEDKFSWKLKDKHDHPQGTIYDLDMVSQVWHDITWKHQIQVYQPKDAKPNATMLLWNTGGKPNPGSIGLGMALAGKIKAPVAFLYNIPNQPIFEKGEDALIAETFVRCLETGDDSWPLLFPMVKGVVKAMDAVQAFAKEEWKEPVEKFVIAGASKRGWTTWLTGAVDPRVVAIAPMVIDTLNMVTQMEHQKKCFGEYSLMLRDYTDRKLVPLPDTDEARRLWKSVDPYFYADKLQMPKMLINANNDPYWAVDALNLYWDKLQGDKYAVYVPNAGHNLQQRGLPMGQERTRTLNALSAFVRYQMTAKPMPRLDWKHDDDGGNYRLTVTGSVAPAKARLWVATAKTADFRSSQWKEQAAQLDKNRVVGTVEPPAQGLCAFYAELEYEIDGIPYTLCTQLRVAGK